MDSFYDQPRKPPTQKTIPMSTDKVLPEIMPEVSMLLENRGNIPQRNAPMSYNAWKLQKARPGDKENFCSSNLKQQPSLYRKQVRFQSPQQTEGKVPKGNDGARRLPPLNAEHALPGMLQARTETNQGNMLQTNLARAETNQGNTLQTALRSQGNMLQTNAARMETNHCNMLQTDLRSQGNLLQTNAARMETNHGNMLQTNAARMETNHGNMLQPNSAANHGNTLQTASRSQGNMLQTNVARIEANHGHMLQTNSARMETNHGNMLQTALRSQGNMLQTNAAKIETNHGNMLQTNAAKMETNLGNMMQTALRSQGNILQPNAPRMETNHGNMLQTNAGRMETNHDNMMQTALRSESNMLQTNAARIETNHGNMLQTNSAKIETNHGNMLQNALRSQGNMLQTNGARIGANHGNMLQTALRSQGNMLQTNAALRNTLQNQEEMLQTNRVDSMLHRVDNVLQMRGAAQQKHKILQSKPFEKIYMANIPNRTLDLSIIEPARPRNVGLYKSQPENRRDSLEEHRAAANSDLFKRRDSLEEVVTNSDFRRDSLEEPRVATHLVQRRDSLEEHSDLYKRNADLHRANRELHEANRNLMHRAESTTIETRRSEPTVTDLLQIIRQQNEQLICLQQQVSTLLHERSDVKKIEPAFNKLEPKFSVDVMTSFEVSIRPQNNYGRKFGNDARITEITELDSTKATDVSLALAENVVVQRDEELSPENSIHVNMQDYSSESETEESNSSLIGWTIYNNVMDQVNYLLHKSQDNQEVKSTKPAPKLDGATMKQVKEVTLKHLKNIGFDLSKINDNDSLDYKNGEYTPGEISFAVKQLLMKYLPDEHLSRFNTAESKAPITGKYPTNLIKRRPEFSMATVQYMEKYNLLNKDTGMKKVPHADKNRDGKLLDITALKRQPKFL